MATQNAEGVFILEKDDVFDFEKHLSLLHVGTYWDPAACGAPHDLDAHAVLLIHRRDDPNAPAMYGGGSHFLTYANKTLAPAAAEDGDMAGFQTADGSMWHSTDNRKGGDAGAGLNVHGEGHEEALSEEMMVHLSKLPAKGAEVAIWLTIHKARERGLDFSEIKGLYVEVGDAEDNELCRYQPTGEFAGFTALQVGSLMKKADDSWSFQAIGAGSKVGLGEIIAAYQG